MTEVERIKLVDISAAELTKTETGLLMPIDGQPAAVNEDVKLVSGHLEGSNVSSIDQLVATMSLNRLFETQVKMMKAAESLSEAGNRIIRGS
jgi:flagellar basal-body rod protein FlgF